MFDIRNEIDIKCSKLSSVKQELENMSQTVSLLETTVSDLHQYSRRNSIRVYGIPEETNENTDDHIVKMVTEKLGCTISKECLYEQK